MEINLNENIREILTMFILILLPLLLLAFMIIVDPLQGWYFYISLITWFGLGIIIYSAIR